MPYVVCTAIETLRECGYADLMIRTMLSAQPRAFLQTPERIREWHAEITSKRMSPLIGLRRLSSTYVAKRKTFSATATQNAADQSDVVPYDVIGRIVEDAVPQQEALSEPDNTRQHEPAREGANAADKDTDESAADDHQSDLVPKQDATLEETAPDSDTHLQDQPAVPKSTPITSANERHTSCLDVSIPDSPAMPDDVQMALLPTPIPLNPFNPADKPERMTPHVGRQTEERAVVPREPPSEPYVPDNATRDWRALAEYILKMVVPNWSPGKWRAWVKNNPWIESLECTEITNLEQILNWVPYGSTKPPNDSRAQLIASVLLNRDLIAVYRKSKRTRGNSGYKTANAPVKRRRILVGLLQLPEEVIYFRFYVLRSIVEREPRKHPDALDYPFERVEKFNELQSRNFSIPPPPMTDALTWQAKAAELRWRVDELKRRHYVPCRKPFVLMLTEPKRAKFLKRLDHYEAEHGHDEIVATRFNK